MKEAIFVFIGGIGLFFFGMQILSEGLKKTSGEKLKKFLHSVTRYPFLGVLVGALATFLVQSSSATTVLTVGFVNAGLLTLKQAISVVMGANIGTTLTAWLVSAISIFKVTNYSLPAIGIGFLMHRMGKTARMRAIGQIILGFGILFTGLEYMKDAAMPLKGSAIVKTAFAGLAGNPLLGVLAGILFTALLQSSSATIAIVQVLAFNGVIGFDAAIPIILGDNIGTTITAQLAALDSGTAARRTAMSHSIFNIAGTAYMLIFVYTGIYGSFVRYIVPGELSAATVMLHIAVAHSLFNIVNTIVFLPFISFLEKASIALVPDKKGDRPQYLEEHLLDSPPIAFELIRRELSYMLTVSRDAVTSAFDAFADYDDKKKDNVYDLEEKVDRLQNEITSYIVKLSQRSLAEDENLQVPVLIHIVNDIERIGDHAVNIIEIISKMRRDSSVLSAEAVKELKEMQGTISEMLELSVDTLISEDPDSISQILELEKKIDEQRRQFKKNHIARLNSGDCEVKGGIYFIAYIDNIEKVGDHLANLAEGIMGHLRWAAG